MSGLDFHVNLNENTSDKELSLDYETGMALMRVQEWYQARVDMVESILSKNAGGIKLAAKKGEEVELDENEAKAFRAGVSVALQIFGRELPIELKQVEVNDE